MSQTWSSNTVAANGIRLHYYRTGGDKPPVVVSHGITDNGLCWTRLARALEGAYDVIMPDARGHGLSDAPADDYSYEAMAADLAGLIRALGLERPALIGHSMGAMTTAVAAANYPGLMRCVILEDPPWRPEVAPASAEQRAARAQEWRADIVQRKAQSREEVIDYCRTERPSSWSEVEYGPWADAKLQMNLKVFNLLHSPPVLWQEVVGHISCPILLVTADPELGAIVTPEIVQDASSLWKNGQAVHIDGAGHNIRREQFERFVAVVTALLEKN